ncbi:MAG: hypothetical protein HOP16_12975 [Acidobacteria bacterium]|nr:hypothetical protein [Acidobacteriota bacterium]
MPFLRVIRDKRGYETTYLMDWYRDGARQRSRILYVFRTPGGVRVGRAPLEPDVLRHIESHYPDIVFDWKGVLDTRQVIDSAPEPRRPPRRRTEEETVVPAPPAKVEAPAAPQNAAPARPAIPAVIEGSTSDERVAFLLHWYPMARERVTQKVSDPVRREALMALAERLNPASWTDADEVATGLQQASEALERLSRVLTRRRRRSGRNRSGRTDAVSTDAGGEAPVSESAATIDPTDLSPTDE